MSYTPEKIRLLYENIKGFKRDLFSGDYVLKYPQHQTAYHLKSKERMVYKITNSKTVKKTPDTEWLITRQPDMDAKTKVLMKNFGFNEFAPSDGDFSDYDALRPLYLEFMKDEPDIEKKKSDTWWPQDTLYVVLQRLNAAVRFTFKWEYEPDKYYNFHDVPNDLEKFKKDVTSSLNDDSIVGGESPSREDVFDLMGDSPPKNHRSLEKKNVNQNNAEQNEVFEMEDIYDSLLDDDDDDKSIDQDGLLQILNEYDDDDDEDIEEQRRRFADRRPNSQRKSRENREKREKSQKGRERKSQKGRERKSKQKDNNDDDDDEYTQKITKKRKGPGRLHVEKRGTGKQEDIYTYRKLEEEAKKLNREAARRGTGDDYGVYAYIRNRGQEKKTDKKRRNKVRSALRRSIRPQ